MVLVPLVLIGDEASYEIGDKDCGDKIVRLSLQLVLLWTGEFPPFIIDCDEIQEYGVDGGAGGDDDDQQLSIELKSNIVSSRRNSTAKFKHVLETIFKSRRFKAKVFMNIKHQDQTNIKLYKLIGTGLY